jgi:hypothetical protein
MSEKIDYSQLRGMDELAVEDFCARHWSASPEVRREFTSKETFTAYCKAEARGWVKVYGGKTS